MTNPQPTLGELVPPWPDADDSGREEQINFAILTLACPESPALRLQRRAARIIPYALVAFGVAAGLWTAAILNKVSASPLIITPGSIGVACIVTWISKRAIVPLREYPAPTASVMRFLEEVLLKVRFLAAHGHDGSLNKLDQDLFDRLLAKYGPDPARDILLELEEELGGPVPSAADLESVEVACAGDCDSVEEISGNFSRIHQVA